MAVPTSSSNEIDRLEALKQYLILDTLPEQDFDDITSLAAEICQMPIALISLVDDKRQWFKSRQGLPLDQTARELSFCAHAITMPQETMVVSDARKDDRFAANPLVTGDPNIVFYAGAPLVDKNGFALGSLCVIDRQPRQLSPNQLLALQKLSRQVITLLELRKANQDLTRSEAQYKQLSLELEQRVAERTQELEKANQDLLRSNDNLQQFAYIASHDLQEPLRKIQAFGGLLENEFGLALGVKGKDYLHRMRSAASRMSTLISDLLAFSRISTRQQTFGLVSLNAIVATTLTTLEITIRETKAQITCEELPVVHGDESQLGQLFQNLLSNAIKFTPPGQLPVVHLTVQQWERHELPPDFRPPSNTQHFYEISVIDQGIGFDTQYLARIFQVFQRLHGKQQYAGTGIGLAICQRVVANHGGYITATSQPGRGATFSVYLPG